VAGRPIHYYTINPAAVAVAAPKPDGPVLLIGRITAPEALQDARIRYRAGSNEVGAYEYHRWMGRPSVMVQDLLLHTLRAAGKCRQVLEASSTAEGDYLVRGSLRELAEIDDPGIQTRVSLRLELVDRQTSAVIWERDYNRDVPVDGKTMNAVVLSMEHNLQQVIGEAASAIEAAARRRERGTEHDSGPRSPGAPHVRRALPAAPAEPRRPNARASPVTPDPRGRWRKAAERGPRRRGAQRSSTRATFLSPPGGQEGNLGRNTFRRGQALPNHAHHTF
jgi:ABC-type uncharacterized transport system auxiliary subunit